MGRHVQTVPLCPFLPGKEAFDWSQRLNGWNTFASLDV
jgi:hypothetical protein